MAAVNFRPVNNLEILTTVHVHMFYQNYTIKKKERITAKQLNDIESCIKVINVKLLYKRYSGLRCINLPNIQVFVFC